MSVNFVNPPNPHGPLQAGDRLAYDVSLRDVRPGTIFISIDLQRVGDPGSSSLPSTFSLTNATGDGDVREVFGNVPAVQPGEYRINRITLTLNGQSSTLEGEAISGTPPVLVEGPQKQPMPTVVSISLKK
jgi:hypothetical protein